MANRRRCIGVTLILGVIVLTAVSGTARDELEAPVESGVFRPGRDLHERRDFRVRATVGTISELQGAVAETTRAFYDVSDQAFKQELAESFDLNDFDMDDNYVTLGLSLERNWKWFSMQFDAAFFNADSSTTAKRNYYLRVGDDIQFQGRGYDNLKIPEGTAFDMEMLAAVIEWRWLFTPFTLVPSEGVRFTPSLDFGIFGFAGQYEIDAGVPTGVTQYLFPPEDFVIGGSSEGFAGMGLPELGIGGELRLGEPGAFNLALEGHYAVCRYDGSTKYIVSSGHREKDADIDHVNIRLRGSLEFPLADGRSFNLGVQYQFVESEADITQTGGLTEEEIIERRERFDKHVDFKLRAVTAMVGLTF